MTENEEPQSKTLKSSRLLGFFDLVMLSDFSASPWPPYLGNLREAKWQFGINHLDSPMMNYLNHKMILGLESQEAQNESLEDPKYLQKLLHEQAQHDRELKSKTLRGFSNFWRRRLLSLNNYLAYTNNSILKIGGSVIHSHIGEDPSPELTSWVVGLGVYDSQGLTLGDVSGIETQEEFSDFCSDIDFDFNTAIEQEAESWKEYVSIHAKASNVLLIFLTIEKFSLEAFHFMNHAMGLEKTFTPDPKAPLIDERFRALKSSFGVEFNYSPVTAEALFKLRQARNFYVHGDWEKFDSVLDDLTTSGLIFIGSELIFAVCDGMRHRLSHP
jgi:hypothetical protein